MLSFHHHKTRHCEPHGRAVLLGFLTLLLSTRVPFLNKISCFVSTCLSSDNSFPSVRQEPSYGPWKGSLFLQQFLGFTLPLHLSFYSLWVWIFYRPLLSGWCSICPFVTGAFHLECPPGSSMLLNMAGFSSVLRKNNILCMYILPLSIHLSINILVFSISWLLQIMLQ